MSKIGTCPIFCLFAKKGVEEGAGALWRQPWIQMKIKSQLFSISLNCLSMTILLSYHKHWIIELALNSQGPITNRTNVWDMEQNVSVGNTVRPPINLIYTEASRNHRRTDSRIRRRQLTKIIQHKLVLIVLLQNKYICSSIGFMSS